MGYNIRNDEIHDNIAHATGIDHGQTYNTVGYSTDAHSRMIVEEVRQDVGEAAL